MDRSIFSQPNSPLPPLPSGGKKVYYVEKNNLSISPGQTVQFNANLDLSRFVSYHVHYLINADIRADVYWKPSINDNFVMEKVVFVPATTGGNGRIVSGATKSRFLKIDFTNTDVIPLTNIIVGVYALH